MSSVGISSIYSGCSVAAGVTGNIFAFVLFVSPIPTFRRILRNKSTEQFSGLPYICSLLNCLITLWYGMPLVSPGIILVATVNSVGAVFQLIYVSIFISYAEKAIKLKISGLLIAVFLVFLAIVFTSMEVFDSNGRRLFVGYLSVASLISMFASPLFIIKLVIKTRSVEFMPFYLSLSNFLMSLSFLAYGLFKDDPFIYVPNGIGTLLGIAQVMLYSYYSTKSGEVSRQPLIDSFA
ncbi:Bidirectional sugar transporter SWEET2a [Citrus sinensis]|uniref:bidirectional sugar transporter SWEET2a-like n=1 Tax=Citrus sinensis TaxID=2711 RepID=UPI0003D7851C|nr:bidirectional sugar transporter SWEET2a-like [Citrus sinensis]KAH9749240.1 Bidirectional sugar transporter SWEET2a [Citrus sinensis]